MPVDPAAVRTTIATDLSDAEIQPYVDDAAAEVERVADTAAMDSDHEDRLVRWYAAYLVRAVRDRSIASGSRQSVSLEYDGSAIAELRRKVRDLDPSGELIGRQGVIRRVADHVGSARPHSADEIGTRDG